MSRGPMIDAARNIFETLQLVDTTAAGDNGFFLYTDLNALTFPDDERQITRRAIGFPMVPTVTLTNADSVGNLIVDFSIQGVDSRCVNTRFSMRIVANAVAATRVSLGCDILIPQFIQIQAASAVGAGDTLKIGYDLTADPIHIVAERIYGIAATSAFPLLPVTGLTASGRLQQWPSGGGPSLPKPTSSSSPHLRCLFPNDTV